MLEICEKVKTFDGTFRKSRAIKEILIITSVTKSFGSEINCVDIMF